MILHWLQNSYAIWGKALLVTAGSLLGLLLVKRLVAGRLHAVAKKTATDVDDLIAEMVLKTHVLSMLTLAIYLGSQMVVVTDRGAYWLRLVFILIWVCQLAIWGNQLIDFGLERYMKRAGQQNAASATMVGALGFFLRMLLYAAIVLLALDNLGIEVTPLVAGLGVGGIAVALAAQSLLGDLFASLTIVFDRPFLLGDFIVVGEHSGTVEHIGLKTTRIRALSGEQLIFSNTDLLGSRIRNLQRMRERRAQLHFDVSYGTSHAQLKAIPSMVKEAVELQKRVRFDRAHLKHFGSHGLNYEVIYWILDPDYTLFMDVQQAIHLEIIRRFEAESISFALPLQNVHLSHGTMVAPGGFQQAER